MLILQLVFVRMIKDNERELDYGPMEADISEPHNSMIRGSSNRRNKAVPCPGRSMNTRHKKTYKYCVPMYLGMCCQLQHIRLASWFAQARLRS